MSDTTTASRPRLLTPEELGMAIKLVRESRQWSQEQLAAIAGLSTRTVQRVENGQPSGIDTRRALARAFGMEDIDALNKPHVIRTPQEAEEAVAKFKRDHLTLAAHPVTSGRHLAGLAEMHSTDLSTPGFEMERPAEEEFAALVDYVRDYRDAHDLYPETEKFEIYDALQERIDALKEMGVSLRFAERQVTLPAYGNSGAPPFKTSVLYLVTFRVGKEPDEFMTPRAFRIG